jgi:hypothetical protein
MFAQQTAAAVRSALLALGLIVWAGSAHAQAQAQQPSAAAISMAKELIALKGATTMYDPVVRGVVEQAKNLLLRSNPMVEKDLKEVTAKLHTEYASRIKDLRELVARVYASRFTEQELKDALTFYKTPLGKKLIEQEPKILDQTMKDAQAWGDQLSQEVMNRIRAEMKKKGHDL